MPSSPESRAIAKAVLAAWESYAVDSSLESPPSSGWRPLNTLADDLERLQAQDTLWLRGELPSQPAGNRQLLIYYYQDRPAPIDVYIEDQLVFQSDQSLPAGFISWRLVDYTGTAGEETLSVRLSTRQLLEESVEVWTGDASALTMKLLRTEAPVWGGALVLALISLTALISYIIHRDQRLFLYFAVFFATLAIDLAILWGGWQLYVPSSSLHLLGSWVHLNWYVSYGVGILVTNAIIGTPQTRGLRLLGIALLLYGLAAIAGYLLLGTRIQQLFYDVFYTFVSPAVLFIVALTVILALRRRKDREIRIFAIGNAVLLGGVIIGKLLGEHNGILSSGPSVLSSHHGKAQTAWTIAGFSGALLCLGLILGIRLYQIAKLKAAHEQILRDNSQLETANSELKKLDQLRTSIFSEVSHELNTPVTAIKGYAQLMLKGTLPVDDPRYLRIILDKTLMMERMIDEMLEITRLENNPSVYDFEELPFVSFFTKWCAKTQLDLADTDLQLSYAIEIGNSEQARSEWLVLADPFRLEQVFNNLVSNSRKFASGQSTLHVSARLDERSNRLQIRFRDTGIGIPTAEQEQIFERYYRGKAAASAAVPGTGLGLPICRGILRAHDGEILLEDSSPGGSTFLIRLPLYRPSSL